MTIKQQGGVFGRNPTFNDVKATFLEVATADINGGTIDGTVIGGTTPAAISGTTGQFDTSINVDGEITGDKLTITGSDAQVYTATGTLTNLLKSNFSTVANADTTVGAAALQLLTVAGASGTSFLYHGAIGGGAGATGQYVIGRRTSGSDYAESLRIDASGNVSLATGNLVLANGAGIDFSATSGTGTSELFDDYEEGRFDTVLTDTGAGSTITLTRARCDYVKVGRLVHVTGEVTIDTITGTPTGDIQMTLPFVGATSNQRSARSRRFISITSLAGAPTGHGEGFIEGNGATVMTLQKADDFIITNLASEIQSGTNFQFDFTYQSAS